MKKYIAPLLLLAASAANASVCTNTRTGQAPFCNGVHCPRSSAATSTGIKVANTIDRSRKFGLVMLGQSLWNGESRSFMSLTKGDSSKHPNLIIANGSVGGFVAKRIADPNDKRWVQSLDQVKRAGLTPQQVKIVWHGEVMRGGDWKNGLASHQDDLAADLRAALRTIKQKFPNVAMIYLTSRAYGGYGSVATSREPFAWGSYPPVVRVLAESSPVWLSHGAYLWADGTRARADGATWKCSDFLEDGLHPGPTGRRKAGDLMYEWIREDATAKAWYLK